MEQRSDIRFLVAEVVDALDRIREARLARDRISDKYAERARNEAIEAMLKLLREVVKAARAR